MSYNETTQQECMNETKLYRLIYVRICDKLYGHIVYLLKQINNVLLLLGKSIQIRGNIEYETYTRYE